MRTFRDSYVGYQAPLGQSVHSGPGMHGLPCAKLQTTPTAAVTDNNIV